MKVGYSAPRGVYGKFYCLSCFEDRHEHTDISKKIIDDADVEYKCLGARCYSCSNLIVKKTI